MPDTLKPCPFCGCKAEVIPHDFFSDAQKKWITMSYGIKCRICEASSYQFFATKERAVKAWNHRVGEGEKG